MELRLLIIGFVLAVAIVSGAFLMAEDQAPPAPAAVTRREALVVGLPGTLGGLDPTATAAPATALVTHLNILEGLTRLEANGEVMPLLATSWKQSGKGKVWRFELRRGVVFSDGTPFDSVAVQYSFERAASPESGNPSREIFGRIARMAPQGSHAIELTLSEAEPAFLYRLAGAAAVILSPDSADRASVSPVGTGPYVIEKVTDDGIIHLARNPKFRDLGGVRIERAEFRLLADAAAEAAVLAEGSVDLLPVSQNPAEAVLAAPPRYRAVTGTTEAELVLAMNNARAPFSDLRVRQAVGLAVDRAAVLAGALDGQGVITGSALPPHHPAFVEQPGIVNLDSAKALMAEAGLAEGVQVRLVLPPPAYARRAGPLIAAQLAAIGIAATVEPMEWRDWLKTVFLDRDYALTLIAQAEPMDILGYARPGYYWGYDSAEFRKIIGKLDAAAGIAARLLVLQDAQRRLADDRPAIFLAQMVRTAIVRNGLVGVWPNAPQPVVDLPALAWQD